MFEEKIRAVSWEALVRDLSEKKMIDAENKEKVVEFFEKNTPFEKDELSKEELQSVEVHSENPWYIRVLIGFGAWLAAFFFSIFLVLFDIYKSQPMMLLLGASLCGMAAFFSREKLNDFAAQLCLCGSLVGQVLLIMAFMDRMKSVASFFSIVLVVQLVMVLINNHTTHRFLSVLFASVALMGWLRERAPMMIHLLVVVYAAVASWMMLVSSERAKLRDPYEKSTFLGSHVDLLRTLANAIAVSLVAVLVLSTMPETSRRLKIVSWIPSAIGLSVVWGVVINYILKKERKQVDLEAVVIGIGLVLFCAFSYQAPGVVVACLLCTLAFFLQSRVLLGGGILSLVFFLSAYYYNMKISLLLKSFTLMIPGIILLGLYQFLRKQEAHEGGNSHA